MLFSWGLASTNENNYYLACPRFVASRIMNITESNTPRRPTVTAPIPPRRLTSEELIGPHRHELVIQHAGSDYRLRITRQGKLILTK
jgi:hemin uptake protein HemP